MGKLSRSDYSYYHSIHNRLFIRISSCSTSIFKTFVDMNSEGMSGTCRAMSKAYGAIKSIGLRPTINCEPTINILGAKSDLGLRSKKRTTINLSVKSLRY